jgi:UDP-3-O-[3-hydroxymyristoyl] glucosamine N-acyltransferase
MLLSELADRLGMELRGEDREFSGLNTLENAKPDEVSFLANLRYRQQLAATQACAVIIAEEFAGEVACALVSANPYFDFARAGAFFLRRESGFTGISDLAVIHADAEVGEGCTIHPYAHVGARARLGKGCTLFPGVYVGDDAVLGDKCTLYPNAVVLAAVELGDECVLRSGAVIGTEGFGFVRVQGRMQAVPQIGTVRLESGVDVGANSCIDRATLGATAVGRHSKLDNLVQIGHNVTLGEQCLIISQVGVAGSTKVGDRVTMAGQAGIAGHLTIGDDVTIGPQAGVPKSIRPGVSGSGSPFMEGNTYLRSSVLMPRLPDMNRRIQQLEKELALLKERLAPMEETPS